MTLIPPIHNELTDCIGWLVDVWVFIKVNGVIIIMISISLPVNERKNLEKYNRNLKLRIIPEVSIIRKTSKLYFLYSPLNLRIYILSGDEYDRLLAQNLGEEEEKLFLENGLLTSENNNPYPITDAKPATSILFFTNRCNLKCIYCFTRGGERQIDNSFERIKYFIDFWKDYENNPNKKIRFFSSGETTLNFPLVKKTYNYLNPLFKKKISLTSNGMFPRYVADWIMKNDINLNISCDGPPYIQNLQRPMRNGKAKSSTFVEKTIKYFAQKKFKHFTVQSVITRHTLNKMEEILNYFYRLEAPAVGFGDAILYGRASKELIPNIVKFAKELMKVIELSDEYGIGCSSPIFLLDVRNRHCEAGSMLVLLENGKIVTCHRATENDKLSKFFTVGECDHNTKKIVIHENKRKIIANRTINDIEECKSCTFKWNCGGDCHSSALQKNKTIFSTGYKCPGIKYVFENFINYKIEKEFIKIKPALEIIDDELYYSMIFNRFKLHMVLNEKEVRPNSFIKITKNTDLEILSRNMIKARNSYGYKTCVFLLSFEPSENILNKRFGDRVLEFLNILRREKIFFIITTPLCRHLFGKKHDKIFKEFKIPKNRFESVEFFRLNGKRIMFSNGKTIRVNEKTRRIDLYNKINGDKHILPFEKCKFCIYRIRKKCDM